MQRSEWFPPCVTLTDEDVHTGILPNSRTMMKSAEMFMHVYPSKQKTFVEHLYNVGPTSKTLGRHCTNVIQMFCVCCVELILKVFYFLKKVRY